MKIVLTSFTPIGAPGGVPRWCRDFKAAFPQDSVVHYSWENANAGVGGGFMETTEWEKARRLNQLLIASKKLLPEDILVGDGFWADSSGMHPVDKTVQVAHGNWSHTTAKDVERGIQPEFPYHHFAQLNFRKRFQANGGRSVAVSDFIADQCRLQWGFEYPVINNGIDLNKFCPPSKKIPRKRPVVIHGVTNGNKGFDHIKLLERKLDADVIILDDAARFFNSIQSERKYTKYQALGQADLVVVPSAHEGNSYFMLEALASNVPVVCYDVGLMWKLKQDEFANVGIILDRDMRSPEYFFEELFRFFNMVRHGRVWDPRKHVSQFSLESFQSQWREYMKKEFGFGV